MATVDGKLQFTDVDANNIAISIPSFGYKTTILLPYDLLKLDNGKYENYDNGPSFDKRSCKCTIFNTIAEQAIFDNFFREDDGSTKGRAYDVTMKMLTNSGFFPLGPDKGDKGDFTVAVMITRHGLLGNAPWQYFKNEIVIQNTGSWPEYSLPTEVSEGNFTFGTVSNCRYPPGWFRPKVDYGYHGTVLEGSTVQWIDQWETSDSYETSFEFHANESKAAKIIEYLTGTVRVSDFTMVTGSGAYPYGRDKGDGTFTQKLIQNEIEITHVKHDHFTFGIDLSFESVV